MLQLDAILRYAKKDKMKVQYCITALTPVMKVRKKKQGSLK